MTGYRCEWCGVTVSLLNPFIDFTMSMKSATSEACFNVVSLKNKYFKAQYNSRIVNSETFLVHVGLFILGSLKL